MSIPFKDGDLVRRSVDALRWNFIGQGAISVIQFGVGVILARLLGPSPFGQVAAALLFVGMGRMVVEAGLSTIIVQRKDLEEGFINECFTAQSLLGTAITGAAVLIVPFFARSFQVEDSLGPLRILCFAFLLAALGQTSRAVLAREFEAGYTQMVQVGSFLIGFVAFGIPIALAGGGAWAIVVANLVQTGSASLAYLNRVRPSITMKFNLMTPTVMVSGARLTVSTLLDWTITNADSLALGRLRGPESLALYGRAYSLAYLPANLTITSTRTVVLSVLSRVQNESAKVSSTALGTLSLGIAASSYLFLTLAVLRQMVIDVLLGEAWRATSGFLLPLAISMIFLVISNLSSAALLSQGLYGREMTIQLAVGLASIPIFVVSSTTSAILVAWAVCGVYACRAIITFIQLASVTPISLVSLFRTALHPLPYFVLWVIWISTLQSVLSIGSPVAHLLAILVIGGLTCIAQTRWLPQVTITTEGRHLLSRTLKRLGKPWIYIVGSATTPT